MNTRFNAGRRSTMPSPTSRASRKTGLSFEKSRLSVSVTSPISTVSNRRQRS